ncbi:hypothetical protein [Sphingopyxis fribergensis]|nr:hypothetical protein [Sphingopyxis fribergensis]
MSDLGRFLLDRYNGRLTVQEIADGIDLDAIRSRTAIPIISA